MEIEKEIAREVRRSGLDEQIGLVVGLVLLLIVIIVIADRCVKYRSSHSKVQKNYGYKPICMHDEAEDEDGQKEKGELTEFFGEHGSGEIRRRTKTSFVLSPENDLKTDDEMKSC
ncbi:unnamed protein product [Heterosigma akashiwo]